MSLVSSIYDTEPEQSRSKGDIEFEIAQLEDQMSNAETEGEREELHYAIGNLYDELEG